MTSLEKLLENLEVGEELEVVPKNLSVGRYSRGIRKLSKSLHYDFCDIRIPKLPIRIPFSKLRIINDYRLATNLDRILLGINLPELQ